MIKSALMVMLCAAPLVAQTERHAALGDRVRVRAPRAGYSTITGDVIATTPDAIQIRVDKATEVGIMRAQIDQLMLSVSSRSHTARGAGVGFFAAAAGAFLFGPKEVKVGQPPGTGKVSPTNVVVAAVGGAAIGALVGHYTRSDTWMRITPQP